jgi:uncharacterized Zn-binding protein involved in type VI secretion
VARLVVVQDDPVEGTDFHNVSGTGKIPGPPGTAPYAGVAQYDYAGKVTDALSDFVSIDGTAAATVGSKSSLNPGETALGGGHFPASGSNFVPPTPTPDPPTLSILDPVGEGTPSATAGSSFVSIGGEAVLLDGDAIDTCDGTGKPMNSTVTADGQSFVSCSA